MTGCRYVTTFLNGAATTDAIEVPFGMMLVGVSLPELTSTTFTITHCSSGSAGTFKTLKDPLGLYGTAGNAITFTVGGTSLGIFAIPPAVVAPLFGYIKLVFGSTETDTIALIFRDIA